MANCLGGSRLIEGKVFQWEDFTKFGLIGEVHLLFHNHRKPSKGQLHSDIWKFL